MFKDNLLTGERGSAVVELAIAVPVICSLFVGSMEFSRLGNYKRKLIEASRYAGFEEAFRKGEADLDKNVAGEIHNLYFADIQYQDTSAIVGTGATSFSNPQANQSQLQLNVEQQDSGDFGGGVGDIIMKVVDFVATGFHITDKFSLGGYGLETKNRTGTQVRIRYKPLFFHFIGATELLSDDNGNNNTNDPNANKWMSLGGDRYYSRFVLTTDPWATTGEADCDPRVQGMVIPDFIIDKIGFDLSSIPILPDFQHPQVDLTLIGPEVVRESDCHCPSNQWDYKCHCKDDSNNPGVQDNGNSATDPAQANQNAHNELNNRRQQLQNAINQDNTNISNDQSAISQDNQNISNDQQALQNAQNANPPDPNAVQQAQNQLAADQGKLSTDQGRLQSDQNQLQSDQNAQAQANGQGSAPNLPPPH